MRKPTASEKLIDLHIHTTASDGSFSPSEVVKLAASAGLSAIAVTDHDTVSGYSEAASEGLKYMLEIIPGVELSTRFHRAVHILGYCIDPAHPGLQAEIDGIISERDRRNEIICSMMREDGLPVYYDELKTRFGKVVGRPHFAKVLTELGYAEDVQDAFRRYLEVGQRYFQRRSFPSIERTLEVITSSGGIPVLAHPFQYRLDDTEMHDLIRHCIDYGLHGIECFYSGYSSMQNAYLIKLASEYSLLQTGGSDFHGLSKPQIQIGTGTGDLRVPYSLLETLKSEHTKKR